LAPPQYTDRKISSSLSFIIINANSITIAPFPAFLEAEVDHPSLLSPTFDPNPNPHLWLTTKDRLSAVSLVDSRRSVHGYTDEVAYTVI